MGVIRIMGIMRDEERIGRLVSLRTIPKLSKFPTLP
jgi:hypothetical protein